MPSVWQALLGTAWMLWAGWMAVPFRTTHAQQNAQQHAQQHTQQHAQRSDPTPTTSESTAPDPLQLDIEQLANGPYSRMEGMVRVTIFRVEVVRVGVRVDPRTRDAIEAIVAEGGYTDARAERIARAMVDADHVLMVFDFQRALSFDRFLNDVRKDLRLARDAELLSEREYRHVSQSLPAWFARLENRGVRRDDLLIYRVQPNALRAVYLANDGKVIVDETDQGEAPRRALLVSYFARDTRVRETLIRSLFE